MLPVRIVLVDDHRSLLDLLAARIDSTSDLSVAGTAANASDGLNMVIREKPDIAVMDVHLPGGGTFDAAQAIVAKEPATKLVFFSGFAADGLLMQALRLGARGYLLKEEPVTVLIDGLRQVAAGGTVFSADLHPRMTYDPRTARYRVRSESPLASLTPRQLEVMRHLAEGRSVKEVARAMHISTKSVDNHKYRIMHKLGIHDRVQLARFAIREGLLLP